MQKLGAPNPTLHLTLSLKKQGDFFVATVSGTQSTPDLWFNGEHLTIFRQKDGGYRALVPVENLSKPGSYAILAKADGWKEKIPVTVVSNNLFRKYGPTGKPTT